MMINPAVKFQVDMYNYSKDINRKPTNFTPNELNLTAGRVFISLVCVCFSTILFENIDDMEFSLFTPSPHI